MHNSQDLQKVLDLRKAILDGSEQRLKEQRDAGKMTARERVEKLADAGSDMLRIAEKDGVVEFISWMQENDKKFVFLTNSPEKTPHELSMKLERMGLSVAQPSQKENA